MCFLSHSKLLFSLLADSSTPVHNFQGYESRVYCTCVCVSCVLIPSLTTLLTAFAAGWIAVCYVDQEGKRRNRRYSRHIFPMTDRMPFFSFRAFNLISSPKHWLKFNFHEAFPKLIPTKCRNFNKLQYIHLELTSFLTHFSLFRSLPILYVSILWASLYADKIHIIIKNKIWLHKCRITVLTNHWLLCKSSERTFSVNCHLKLHWKDSLQFNAQVVQIGSFSELTTLLCLKGFSAPKY